MNAKRYRDPTPALRRPSPEEVPRHVRIACAIAWAVLILVAVGVSVWAGLPK